MEEFVRNLTLNYGVRYDYELTEQIPTLPLRDPLSGITLSAADSSGSTGRDGRAARLPARQEQLGAASRGRVGSVERWQDFDSRGVRYLLRPSVARDRVQLRHR